MPSKLVITLKDGTTIESENLDHTVAMAGDLVLPGHDKTIPATEWKSVHVEEVKPKPKKKAAIKKETADES